MYSLWIRTEYKENEMRAALAPEHARVLINKGYKVYVEKSNVRIFTDDEYSKVGCIIVDAGSWIEAPLNALVLGLKPLPKVDEPIKHKHIFFAHAYNSKRIFDEKHNVTNFIEKIKQGVGLHYDLEFLANKDHKRICAFGQYAGKIGAYLALLIWHKKHVLKTRDFHLPLHFQDENTMLNDINTSLMSKKPSILILGETGRCAIGAICALNKLNLEHHTWGRPQTSNHKKLKEIFNYDILINCIGANEETNTFINKNDLENNYKLSVISDVGCETSNNNPIKIYKGTTTTHHPTHKINSNSGEIDIIAIDNLPSLMPRESSIFFSQQLLPELNNLLSGNETYPWQYAKSIFLSCLNL